MPRVPTAISVFLMTQALVLHPAAASATLTPTCPRLNVLNAVGVAMAQERIVSGTVVDRAGQPVAAAAIQIIGSPRIYPTDGSGRFTIPDAPDGELTLRISNLGYATQTVTATAGDRDIEVVLTESAIDLDALVVTGTPGATRKRAVGNAISRIDATSVTELAPIQEVGQLLKGRSAGTLVRSGVGSLGATPRILIRGSASLSLGDQPLIYVDGVRVDNAAGNVGAWGSGGRLNDFAPADIETIEIIKGPAAATLYGTEAANGVIQIITRRGQEGETRFNVAAAHGTIWMRNPEGRYQDLYVRNDTGVVQTVNPFALATAEAGSPYRNGWLQSYSANVTGGSGLLRFYLSGDYEDAKGAEPLNAQRKWGVRSNLSAAPSDRLDINANLSWVNVDLDTPVEADFGGTMFGLTTFLPEIMDTRRRGWFFGSPDEWNQGFQFFQDTRRFIGSVQLNHRPTVWLAQRLNLGFDHVFEATSVLIEKMPPDLVEVFGAGLGAGTKTTDDRVAANYTFDYSASATKNVGDLLGFTTSIGAQYYKLKQTISSARADAFPATGLTSISSGAVRTAGESFVENATLGVFLQEQAAINDRLYLTAAVRADDNSAFGENFSLVYYPKFSAAWVVSEEPFLADRAALLNTLRLRAAYGRSGQQPRAFDAVRTYTAVTGSGSEPALTATSLGNPDLAPEVGQELELGLDLELFDNRVGIDVTYYHQGTQDLITPRIAPPSLGFPGNQLINLGEITNSGFELLVSAGGLELGPAAFELSFNLGTNRSEVVEVGDGPESHGFILAPAGAAGAGVVGHQEGFPIAGWLHPLVIGADVDADGNATNVVCDGGAGKLGLEPGGAPVPCESAPSLFLGRSQPSYWGSIMPKLTLFDRLHIVAQLDFQGGYKVFDTYHSWRCVSSRACSELVRPEQHTNSDVVAGAVSLGGDATAAFALHDAKFMKLRELSATYDAPRSLAARIGAQRLSFSIAGRDLALWTPFPGLDPESRNQGANAQFASSNYNASPSYARFIGRMSVTF